MGPIGIDRVHLTNTLATPTERRTAKAIALLAGLLAVLAVPFVRTPLLPMPAFIPAYEAALFFIDLITAALLFDQSLRQRSISLLLLACGYLFDALIIVPHALSFPGAFVGTGLLSAGPQTTAWLYVFWHGGFPLYVIGYALVRNSETRSASPSSSRIWAIAALAAVLTLAVVIALTVLATRGHDLLPVVMQGGDYSLLVSKGISPAVWAITLLAMLSLWQRPQRLIDLWLMLVMWIWLFDIALSAVIGSNRFDLGFYVGRLFGLVASSFLLVTLVLELAKLYAGSMTAAERAEHRLAQLIEEQGRLQASGRSTSKTVSSFVQSENIVRFRTLLESGELDEQRKSTIRRLLAEEEARLRDIGGNESQ